MSRLIRRGEVSVNRVGRFRCAAFLAAVLGWLLAVSLAPAHADMFPGTLLVGGHGTILVGKGPDARVRIQYDLPAVDTAGHPWQLRVAPRDVTCTADESASLVFVRTLRTSSARRGYIDLDLSGADFPADVVYVARMCVALDRSGRHHKTNPVYIRLGTIAATRPGMVLPGMPQIVSAITPVRPGYMIGVFGRDFGERTGRLLISTSAGELPLSDLDWHSRGIAGRIPRIEGVRDGPVFLIVERADGTRSPMWSVRFVATREVRAVPGGEVRVDSCSDEATSNWCGSPAFPDAPSLNGHHYSDFTTGESGTDGFSIALANGWRLHELRYSHGNRDTPPTWNYRGDSTHPRIQVRWRNPGGFGVRLYYGFRLYISGPAGVPHR